MKAALVLCCIGLAMTMRIMPGDRPKYVPGEYILRLDENLIENFQQEMEVASYLEENFGLELIKSIPVGKLKFMHLKGGDDEFLGQMPAYAGIKFIERNAYGYLDQCIEQPSPGTWGLDRIDQVEALPNATDPIGDDAKYIYGGLEGASVAAYILDTGIDIEHPEFGGRAYAGYAVPGWNHLDNHGHGTHCAGTVGSLSYGVAKSVRLVAVKVVGSFGGSSVEKFLGGMHYIITDHRERSVDGMARSVINISLGYTASDAIDASIQEASDQGISMAVSAGNSNVDACRQSPSRAPAAITTGKYSDRCFFIERAIDLRRTTFFRIEANHLSIPRIPRNRP